MTDGLRKAALRTHNVRSFSLDLDTLRQRLGVSLASVSLDSGTDILLDSTSGTSTRFVNFQGPFSVAGVDHPRARRYGPLISILSSPLPITLVVGSHGHTVPYLRSIASRIAHDAYVYGKLSFHIVLDVDFVAEEGEGNVVLLGDAFLNSVVRDWSINWPTPGESSPNCSFSRSSSPQSSTSLPPPFPCTPASSKPQDKVRLLPHLLQDLTPAQLSSSFLPTLTTPPPSLSSSPPSAPQASRASTASSLSAPELLPQTGVRRGSSHAAR